MKIVSRKDMESTAFESASLFLVMAVLLIGCAGGGLRGSGMDSASGEGGSSLGGDVGLGGTSTGGVGGVSLVGGASGAGQTKGGSGGHFSLGGPSAGVGGASLAGGASGAGPAPSGGAVSQGGETVTSQGGRASDGAVPASPDAPCDTAALWAAITYRPNPFTSCFPTRDGDRWWWEVVLDDNTGLLGAGKQAWLDSLANERWPCLAGQTLRYTCETAG
jgi:hypothetical protein